MSENTLFRLILTAIFVSIMALAVTYRRKAEPVGGKVSAAEAKAQEGALIFYWLRGLGVLLWIGTPIYLIVPSAFAWAAVPVPLWLRWVGVGIAVTLPFLVAWAQRSLGNNVTKTVVTKQEHALVTSGPYRWIRHPLYTFAFLFFMCLSVIAANAYFAAVITLGYIPLMLRTRQEEAMLAERFGDEYRAYVKRTGRFFPRLIG